MKRLFDFVWVQVWLTGVVALVLLALYTSAGRQLIPLVANYKYDVEELLSEQLNMPVSIRSMEGDWDWFSPLVLVEDVQLGDGDDALRVQNLKAEFDISATIFYRTPVFKSIDLTGVNLPFVEVQDDQWFLGGIPLSGSEEKNTDRPVWLDLLTSQGELRLYGWNISVQPLDEIKRQVSLLDVRLRNNGEHHWLDGKIQLGGIDGAVMIVQVSSEGDLWNLHEQQAQAYLSLPAQEWQPWLPEIPTPWSVNQLNAGLSAWLDIRDGQLATIDGYLDIPEFEMVKSDEGGTRPISFEEGLIRFSGRSDENDWHLWFKPEVIWRTDSVPPLPTGRISRVDDVAAGGWQLYFDDVDLQQTSQWIRDFSLLAAKHQKYLTNLRPRGRAQNLAINWLQGDDSKIAISLNAKATGIDAWGGIPAAENINAKVELTPSKGRAVVDSKSGSLHFPALYKKGWSFDRIGLTGHWNMFPDYLHIVAPEVDAEYKGAGIKGGFSLYSPLGDGEIEPQLNLLLGLTNAPVDFHKEFIPSDAAAGLQDWLDTNLHKGSAKQGEFLFVGSTASDAAENSKSMQLYLDVQDAELSYLPNWPHLKGVRGRVLVDSPQVDIWMNRATTLGGELVPNSGRIKIYTQADKTTLTVNGQLQGDAAEGVRYLQDTPLRDQMSGTFDSWRAKGDMHADLFVQLPMSGEGNPHIRLQTDFQGVDLAIEDLKLEFSDSKGSLIYDSKVGISSEGLSAKTFGGKSIATIESQKIGNEFDLLIKAKGDADVAAVKDWNPLFLMKPVTGTFDYDLDFWIRPLSRGGLDINIESDLLGVKVDTPAPFGKTSEEALDFKFSINKYHELRLGFTYGKLANGTISLGDNAVERGQIYLGSARSYVPSASGIEIKGHLAHHLDAKAWWDLWQDIKPEEVVSEEVSDDSVLKRIDITMPAIDAWGQQMGTTHVKGEYQWGEWLFDVNSELMKGKVTLPSANKAISLNLEYIHLPVQDKEGPEYAFGSIEAPDTMQDFNPAWVPNLDMKLQELYVGTQNYGRWDLSVRQKTRHTEIKIHDSLAKAMRVQGDVIWRFEDGSHTTDLMNMKLSSENLGDVQRGFSMSPAIEAQHSRFYLDMGWQGSPLKFNYPTLNGNASVRIRDGVLISDGAGALKAFGILNFDSISRRLKLDFSDLYESGVSFDIMKTKLNIEDGLMTFKEPMWVDGPSAKFQTSGTVNLVTEEIDQKLAVTFPITSSLPLVAVLAGLAPQVAGAIYVTEKLIGEELEQFTSASYNVTGTFREPVMEIDQAFNNEVEGQESKSLKDRFLNIFGAGED